MQVKFSQDVIPLSELKVNPGKVINRAKNDHRPILLTSRGKGIAVVQGLAEYEENQENQAFMQAITRGLIEIKEGSELSLDDVKNKLGIS